MTNIRRDKRLARAKLAYGSLGTVTIPIVLVTLGMLGCWGASRYSRGDLSRIGPGAFPIAVCSLLVACGFLLLLQQSHVRRPPRQSWVWQSAILAAVSGSLLSFALIIGELGVVPAAFTLAVLGSLARGRTRPTALLLIGCVAAAGCVLFVYALGLRVPVIRW